MHIPYLDQAKKWAQSNPHTNCHQFGIRGCQLNMIFLIIILVLVATIVALSLVCHNNLLILKGYLGQKLGVLIRGVQNDL